MDQFKFIRDFNDKHQLNVVYDIGAYKGAFTKNLSKHINASFYMFEASPHLKKPTGLGKHQWYNAVLYSADDKEITWYDNETGSSYYIENPEYASVKYKEIKLKTKKLITLTKENNIPLPDLIKIDTQASELDVLQDCSEILHHCKLIHCEIPAQGVEPYLGTPSYEEYMDFFNQNGFIYSTKIKDHLKQRKILIQHDYFFMKEKIV